MKKQKKETIFASDNPFEEAEIARQWINSVENEKGMIRDLEIYPKLKEWSKTINSGVILDIGAGQGVCADYVHVDGGKYIGVDSSVLLVKRARELYEKDSQKFIVGSAYQLPVLTESVSGAFSVNVWFHLNDLKTASKELARVLKRPGKFLIITANPDSYDIWRSMYFDATEDEKKIDGKVNVPINPMSRNIFYKHTLGEVTSCLTSEGLIIDDVQNMGFVSSFSNKPIFICITGHKGS